MNYIRNIQFTTDDGEIISVFIEEALAEVQDKVTVNLQVPVFADGRSGHIYLTGNEVVALSKSPIIREATRWALSTRMRVQKPRRS